MKLSFPAGYGSGRRSNWADGPRGSIENKLASVFRELEARAAEDTLRAEEWTRKQEVLQREREEHERRAQLLRIDRARAARLAEEASAWRLAADVRAYVSALRERLPELEDHERERLSEWCAWATDWAARADPVTNTRWIAGFSDHEDALTGVRP